MNLLLKHKILTGITISLIHSVLILPITESIWFKTTNLTHDQAIFSSITKLLFFIFLTAIAVFVLHFISRLRTKDTFYKKWLLYTLIYLGLMGIILLLIWPGYWRWDELDVLYTTHNYLSFSWQSIHTQLQYIFSLYLLPFNTGITIIQITAISAIVGYIVASLERLLKRPFLAYLLALPLVLSPVVLLGNFYTLRAHIIGYLITLLLFKVLLLFVSPERVNNRYFTFIGLSLLVAILATWRSENVFYFVFIPFFWIYFRFHRNFREQWKLVSITTIAAVAIVMTFIGLTRIAPDPAYEMTSNLNTLSMMVHDNLSDNAQQDLNTINQVINIDILKEYPTYCDIVAYWRAPILNGRPLLNDNWQQGDNPALYKRALLNLFVHNPDLFLKYKALTYLATNYMKPETGRCNLSIGTGQFVTSNKTEHVHQYANFFHDVSKLSSPIDARLRTAIISGLVLINHPTARSIVWNVTPILLLCLAVVIHALIRRRLYWLLVLLPLFIHTFLVFIAAPAVIFMYYFPVYLAGLMLSLIYIILLLDSRLSQRMHGKKHAIIKSMITPTKFKVLIAIPTYNCAPQITRVLKGIDKKLQGRIAEVAVIDNGSTDNTIERALEFKKTAPYKSKLHIYKNNDNYNLGGTHKVAFLKAEKEGFTHVVILHGDDQAKSSEVNDLLDYAESNPQQTVLGSRFSKDSRLEGYDLKRILGNKVLNIIFSVITLRKLEDLGSGINLFYLKDLDKKTYLKFADKLTFNYELILDLVKRKVNFAFLPITWSEEDQVSNARNVTIFKTALVNVIRWRINKPTVNETRKTYSCKEVK